MKRFHGLGPKQEEVFRQIAFGHDGSGCHRETLKTLERRGLIVGYDEQMYGSGNSPVDRIAMTVRKYHVTLPVHMEYCQWCADVCDTEEAPRG